MFSLGIYISNETIETDKVKRLFWLAQAALLRALNAQSSSTSLQAPSSRR